MLKLLRKKILSNASPAVFKHGTYFIQHFENALHYLKNYETNTKQSLTAAICLYSEAIKHTNYTVLSHLNIPNKHKLNEISNCYTTLTIITYQPFLLLMVIS